MEDNRKKKIRKALEAMRDNAKGYFNERPASGEDPVPYFDRGRQFVKHIQKKRVKQIKEQKLDYDLVKKFRKRKDKLKSTKQQLKELKRERNVVPYSLKKNYVQQQSNTEMISSYDAIKKVPPIVRQGVSPSVPKPKDLDYKRGYVKRYFVQRANDNRAPINEVSSIKFSQIATNAFFKQVKLRWRITGPLEDYKDAEGNLKKGVYTSNKRSIEEQLKKMPSLKNRLVNLGEYHTTQR